MSTAVHYDLAGDCQVLVNQVGYDSAHPKKFIVQCRHMPETKHGTFVLVDAVNGEIAFAGELCRWGRVYDGTEHDWGFDYWTGEFSEYRVAGNYIIRVSFGGITAESYPFQIGVGVLWNEISPLAFRYFRNARNFAENFNSAEKANDPDWVPKPFQNNGILEDDGRFYDVNGAWFEFGAHGGTFLRDATRVMLSILWGMERDPASSMIQDEMQWGADWWKKIMLRYPESALIVSGMGGWHADNGKIALYEYPFGLHEYMKFYSMLIYARLYELTGDVEYLGRGELMWEQFCQWVETDKVFSLFHETGKSQEADGINYRASWKEPGFNYTKVDDAAFLFGDVALFRATGNERYLRHAERMVDNILSEIDGEESYFKFWNNNYSHDNPSALAYFADKLPDHPKTNAIKAYLEAFMDAMIRDCAVSPFGVARKNFIYYESWNPEGRKPDATRAFFNRSEEGKGVNPEYGLEVWQALLIHRAIPKKEYVDFALNHINWVLGLNPRNLCMMKGAGTANPKMRPGGMLDGCVCHGLIADHGYDRPWLGLWMDTAMDWHKDQIAGYKIWAQGEALIRGTACFMMGLGLLE